MSRPMDGISELERAIFQKMRDYRTNQEIAAELFIAVSSVGVYVNRIYKRHGVCNRLEFLRMYREKIGCRYD